jgi:hypothetical protein
MAWFQRRAEELVAEGKVQEATKFKVLPNEAAVQLAPYVQPAFTISAWSARDGQ